MKEKVDIHSMEYLMLRLNNLLGKTDEEKLDEEIEYAVKHNIYNL